jgi:tRNA(Met) C34 N-acetyltransferase TmcA
VTRDLIQFVVQEGELTKAEQELKELKASLRDTEPIGSIIDKARTLDQAKAVLTFYEAISEKSLRSTVALTASRGRGKSAALGLAIAAAVAFGCVYVLHLHIFTLLSNVISATRTSSSPRPTPRT